jgi:hypothetical protein
MNKFVKMLALVLLVAGIIVPVCIASGQDNNVSYYTSQAETSQGKINITATMPIVSIGIDDNTTFSQMEFQTWYAIDTGSVLPGSYSLSTRIANVTDLKNVDVRVESPTGISYLGNLNVSQVNGKWLIDGNHSGIIGIGISDETNVTPWVYLWGNDTPIVLPDFVQNQEFALIIYAKTDFGNQSIAAANNSTSEQNNVVDNGNIEPVPSAPAETNTRINTSSGKINVVSNMPLKILTADHDIPMDQLDLNTWYGFDTSSVLPGSYAVGTRIVKLADLNNLNVSVDLPNGKQAYARNFRLSQVNGKWKLDADHDGIISVFVTDYYLKNSQSYNWLDANQQTILPDFVQNQEFMLYVYVKVK